MRRNETNKRIRFRSERSQGKHLQTLPTEESEGKEEGKGRYIYVLMATIEEKAHTQNCMCLSLFVRLDYYFVANTLLPFNASSISFDFVHPVNEQSRLSLLYALSLIEMQILILSSFFLFIMVFFLCVWFVVLD